MLRISRNAAEISTINHMSQIKNEPSLITYLGWQWYIAKNLLTFRFSRRIRELDAEHLPKILFASCRTSRPWQGQWIGTVECILAYLFLAVRRWGPMFLMHHHQTQNEAVYRYFGFENFIFSHQFSNARQRDDLDEWLQPVFTRRDEAELRELFYEGVPVGRLGLASARLYTKKSRLVHEEDWKAAYRYVKEAAAEVDVSHKILDQVRPLALITNHSTYSDGGGPIFHVALKLGIPTYSWQCRGPNDIVFRRMDIADPLEHVSGIGEQEWQSYLSSVDTQKKAEDAHAWLRDRMEGLVPLIPGAPLIGRKNQPEANLDGTIDPDRPNIAVFTHLPWDAAGSFYKDIYATHADFVEDTVRTARETKSVNWIFRIHPAEAHRGTAEDTQKVIESLLDGTEDNIKIIPSSRPISSYALLANIHAAVGIRGTLAVEAPCVGVPFIAAGTGQTTVAKFSRSYETVEEYRNALRKIETINPLSNVEIQEARVFAQFFFRDAITQMACTNDMSSLFGLMRLTPRSVLADQALQMLCQQLAEDVQNKGDRVSSQNP